MFTSFFIVLVKLFCVLIHGIPDQVRDDGEELILRQAQDDRLEFEMEVELEAGRFLERS